MKRKETKAIGLDSGKSGSHKPKALADSVGVRKKSLRLMASPDHSVFHLYILNRALYGMTHEAKQLLNICAMYLDKGVPPPEPFAKYLAHRLARIGELDEPWGVPLLARQRGQKGRDQYDSQQAIALEVYRLHDLQRIPLRAASSSASPGALEMVAKQFNVSIPTANKHYRKFLPQLKR